MGHSKPSIPVTMVKYCPKFRFPTFWHLILLITLHPNYIHTKSIVHQLKSTGRLILQARISANYYHHRNPFSQTHANNSLFLTYIVITVHLLFLLLVLISLLLILAGDIHSNPGPTSTLSSSSDSSFNCYLQQVLQTSNGHLSFIHYNVQSILPKLDSLRSELNEFDILAFSETWLNGATDDSDIEFDNYNTPERKDRTNDSYGGVIVYVKKDIAYSRRTDLEVDGVECIWLQIHISTATHLLFGLFYRPPNSNAIHDLNMENSLHLAIDTNISNIVVTGDFNLNPSVPTAKRKLERICQQLDLVQCIDEPTNFTEHSSSLIDLILTNNRTSIKVCGVSDPFLDQPVRYHCPIFGILNIAKPKCKTHKRRVWIYNKGNFELLRRDLNFTDWTNIQDDNLNIWVDKLTKHIIHLAEKHIPNRVITINPNEPRWITSTIKSLIRKRKRQYHIAKRTNSQSDWEKFKRLRNKTTLAIKTAKKTQLDNCIERLNTNSNSKSWWSIIKQFLSPSRNQNSIPALKNGDIPVTDDTTKSEIFNDYFVSQTSLNDSNKADPIPPVYNLISTLSDIHILESDVSDTLKTLKTGKAVGPDKINNRLLIEAATELSKPLADMFNKSMQIGIYPNSWKIASVVPVFKKGDRSIVSNYRPISLLSTISKVFERIVYKYLFNHIVANNILTKFQSGFLPKDSTTGQLAYLYHNLCKTLDSGKEVRVVFCDVSKAFDRVWHRGILIKLKSIGIEGNLLTWFENYLYNRRQYVSLNNVASSTKQIKAGVPQGSILGPLLFLIYINDIVRNIRSDIKLFADDTSLSITVDDITESAAILNRDIDDICKWAQTWLVSFNPNKTESMIISKKVNKPVHPPLCMLNQVIQETNTHKHLGVHLSNDCSWHNHIDSIKTKAWGRINIMRKLKFILDRKSLEVIYKLFIRPILEYCDVLFSNCTFQESKELESIQIEAARIATGSTKLVSLNNLRIEIGWESLDERRNKHQLILMYNILHNQAPAYLHSVLPDTHEHNYHLRNAHAIPSFLCRTTLYYNSLFPRVIRQWNDLPINIQTAPSLQTFKRLLDKRVPSTTVPSYYYFGPRKLQIIHTRIRTGCSSLNAHLYSKNIIESPNCLCGEVESPAHFFLTCPLYNQSRLVFLQSISQIQPPINLTINTILFGCSNITEIQNKFVFRAAHQFIENTKRFG